MNLAVPGFDIVERIGSGGFSRVFRATQRDLGRDVALKVLSVDMETAAQRGSFERECKAMGALAHHPSIVSVFAAAFSEDGRPCIVMEYFAAGTLADRVEADGRLDINAALQAGIEVAGALQTAHDHGVVHRDIKPSNLFVSAFGGAVLGDFGIASVDDERTVTGGGGLTVHYAPPELIEGEPASIASDIYSLAATLFTLVSGDKPFPRGPGQSTADLARRILLEPTPVLGDDAPPPLVSLLERAMAKRPDRRPSSAAAFGYELQQVQVDLGYRPTPLIAVGHEPIGQLRSVADPTDNVMGGGVVGLPPRRSTSWPAAWSGSGSRRLTAAALAALALTALGSTAVALGRRDADAAVDRNDATATVEQQLPDQFFELPSVPTDVRVEDDANGRSTVSWDAGEGRVAVAYQIEIVGSGAVVETSETSAVLETDSPSVCVVVRAVGDGGRLSADSEPVCRAD